MRVGRAKRGGLIWFSLILNAEIAETRQSSKSITLEISITIDSGTDITTAATTWPSVATHRTSFSRSRNKSKQVSAPLKSKFFQPVSKSDPDLEKRIP